MCRQLPPITVPDVTARSAYPQWVALKESMSAIDEMLAEVEEEK